MCSYSSIDASSERVAFGSVPWPSVKCLYRYLYSREINRAVCFPRVLAHGEVGCRHMLRRRESPGEQDPNAQSVRTSATEQDSSVKMTSMKTELLWTIVNA